MSQVPDTQDKERYDDGDEEDQVKEEGPVIPRGGVVIPLMEVHIKHRSVDEPDEVHFQPNSIESSDAPLREHC